jgi:hypothetical protein
MSSILMLSQESKKSEWLSKKRQMQGAQLSGNEAYYDYAAVTRAIAATQQLVSFCDAIHFGPYTCDDGDAIT